jgi:hypothetical protein
MPTRTSVSQAKPAKAKKSAGLAASNLQETRGELLAKLENAGITAEDRWKMISEMAYYRAQQRGFGPEGQMEDWLEAESVIDSMLAEGSLKSGIPHH